MEGTDLERAAVVYVAILLPTNRLTEAHNRRLAIAPATARNGAGPHPSVRACAVPVPRSP